MITDELKKDLYAAMKEKDAFKSSVLRYLLSQIKNKEIELKGTGEELTDEHVLKVIKKRIKEQKQSIEQFEQAGRHESVEEQKRELELIRDYFEKFGGVEQGEFQHQKQQ